MLQTIVVLEFIMIMTICGLGNSYHVDNFEVNLNLICCLMMWKKKQIFLIYFKFKCEQGSTNFDFQ
jgi:hypothetical protein